MEKHLFVYCALLCGVATFSARAQDQSGEAAMETITPSSDTMPGHKIDISLPDTIYAVVGDTLQLFYRGMIKAPNPYFYDILKFSACAPDAGNPFWNAARNQLDIKSYADKYCHGRLDVAYFLLSWNAQTAHRTDFTTSLADARKIFNHIHAVFPDATIKLMGIQVPSVNGGMGANYGATGTSYSDMYGMVVTALNQNEAYQDLANEAEYADFVEFINISVQFDSENNMPERDVPVNTRNAKTEKRGTNGVHPAPAGYYQIADAVFRNFVAGYCQ